MLRKIITCIVAFLLYTGHSFVLNAQCTPALKCTSTFNLNEVVICHKGACGKDGSFALSRSASLFPTVTFQLSSLNNLFCIDCSRHLFHNYPQKKRHTLGLYRQAVSRCRLKSAQAERSSA